MLLLRGNRLSWGPIERQTRARSHMLSTAWPWARDGNKLKALTNLIHQPVDCRSRIMRRNLISKTGRARTVNGRFSSASVAIYVAIVDIVNRIENIATVGSPRWHNVKVTFQFIADKKCNFWLGAFVCSYWPWYKLDLLKMVFVAAVRPTVVSRNTVWISTEIWPSLFSLKRCELWTV